MANKGKDTTSAPQTEPGKSAEKIRKGTRRRSKSANEFKSSNEQDRQDIRTAIAALAAASGEQARLNAIKLILRAWASYLDLIDAIVVPAFEKADGDEKLIAEMRIERDLTNIIAMDLLARSPNDPHFEAEVQVFTRHLSQALDLDTAYLAKLEALGKEAGLDLMAVEARVTEMRADAKRRAEQDVFHQVPCVLRSWGTSRTTEEFGMADYRDRDERGRFMSEDEDRYGRRGGHREEDYRRSRGRSRDEDEGRGWHGDREGHAEAAYRGWDMRRSERRGEEYDDQRRPSHGRGQSGWYGDPEGHAEASRRGWDERRGYGREDEYERRSSRGREDEDERYYRGRRHEDDDRRSSYGRSGHGGWFGDPEGHSEASRRGWDDRRRG